MCFAQLGSNTCPSIKRVVSVICGCQYQSPSGTGVGRILLLYSCSWCFHKLLLKTYQNVLVVGTQTDFKGFLLKFHIGGRNPPTYPPSPFSLTHSLPLTHPFLSHSLPPSFSFLSHSLPLSLPPSPFSRMGGKKGRESRLCSLSKLSIVHVAVAKNAGIYHVTAGRRVDLPKGQPIKTPPFI